MSNFKIHNIDSAPEGSKPLLKDSSDSFGMIPNLHGVMAEAPKVLEAYQRLHTLFSETSFNANELNVIWLAINVEHDCHYCIPAHTGIAKSMNVDDEIINALREKKSLSDKKLNALLNFTLTVVRKRGEISQEELAEFTSAGYTQQQVLEVILGVSQKIMSNYINHIAKTPVDDAFKQFI
ncbi:hypothetical protein A28LD_0412 [Idiomarina sp. A28L]|uniref:carboxymuconolactone decarboxylase family protein n=1 Tax=Idiomarina sp. A28L TaxID=1036674 RepID=UPI0002138B08|nr:carboxymuconolactone decarboxylase family protein [Idiomarina sp. A28L]EGN75924.1 hypothetical protein A28LD_0412 [Idiomarina sp. A28L]